VRGAGPDIRQRFAGACVARGYEGDGRPQPALGTAIATFDVNGHWPGKPKGNHAAFYLSQTSEFIRVIDQWNAGARSHIAPRLLRRLGKNPDGSYVTPSDNADAFSVIE
jgi:hypothetical protein